MGCISEIFKTCESRFGRQFAAGITIRLLGLDVSTIKGYSQDWEESQHPRGEKGRFVEKGGGKTAEGEEEKYESAIETTSALERGKAQGRQNTPEIKSSNISEKPKTERIEPKKFVNALEAAKASVKPRKAWRVDSTRSAEDYEKEGIDCYVCEGGSTFGLKKDGDIVSVCKNTNGNETGSEVLQEAIQRGGNHLDSYDGNYEFYVRNGFEVVSRCRFDKKYALPGWEESKDKGEDIIFMKYMGKGKTIDDSSNEGFAKMKKRVPYSKDYQQAEKVLADAMKGWKKPDENN